MSVVSRLTVTPSRIEALVRLVEHDGGSCPTDSISSRLVVQSLVSGGETNFDIGEVVAEAAALGLVEKDAQVVRLRIDDTSRESIIRRLDKIMLFPESARASGHDNFPYALAWMLTYDPLRPIPWNGLGIDIASETGQSLDITNDQRGQQMHYWARYLGFTRELQASGGRWFIPDPSVALRRHLEPLFNGDAELSASEFMHRWAERCPVVDGGTARVQVESWMRDTRKDERLPAANTISGSASQALNHLDRTGELRLVSTGADDSKLSLALPGAKSAISHIRRGEQPT
jgi:hypothetical protein